MDRKSFIRQCGLVCLGASYVVSFLEGCVSSKTMLGHIDGSDLVIPLNAFEVPKKSGMEYLRAIIVEHSSLQHSVCVFRDAQTAAYSAVLMRCTHQGAALQLFGEKFECPAHGSQFDSHGVVTEGPADANLRAFPVKVEQQSLRISLV
jgi:Rieske Fe-S protein